VSIGFLAVSYASPDKIEIVQLPNDKDIIVNHYWSNRDSLEVFIPYKFEIKNNAVHEVLIDIRLKGTPRDQCQIFDTNGEIMYDYDGIHSYVPALGSKKIYLYSKLIDSKKNIDSLYWFNISQDEMFDNHRKLPTKAGKMDLAKWKKIQQNDTVTFKFDEDLDGFFKDYILKTGKVNSYSMEQVIEQYWASKKKDSLNNLKE
jgi:hypothetical protein